MVLNEPNTIRTPYYLLKLRGQFEFHPVETSLFLQSVFKFGYFFIGTHIVQGNSNLIADGCKQWKIFIG